MNTTIVYADRPTGFTWRGTNHSFLAGFIAAELPPTTAMFRHNVVWRCTWTDATVRKANVVWGDITDSDSDIERTACVGLTPRLWKALRSADKCPDRAAAPHCDALN